LKSARLESILSSVLTAGVWLSVLLLTIAIIIYAASKGSEIALDDDFRVHAPSLLHYLFSLPSNGFGVRGLMAAGLAILLLTPYVRVATSLTYFAYMRDIKYVLITLFVLVVLTASLLTH